MPPPETIGAYVIAILGFLGAIHAKYDARKVAKDKQDSDARMAEIAAGHDSKILILEEKLKDCQAGHLETQRQLLVSETDRMQMRERLAALEKKVN